MTIPPPVVRLTVAILARDAADPLRRTLAAVRDIADEILVVDTGSVDDTRQVAHEFSAQVLDFPWNEDFAAARNFGQRHATGNWVLWLDAGEFLSEVDSRGLRTFVQQEADVQCAYVLLIRTSAGGPREADEQIGRVRLLPQVQGITFSGRVRETPEPSLATMGRTLAGAPFLIRRGKEEQDAGRKRQRAVRNLRLAERELAETGPAARLWNCLGESLQSLGDPLRATKCFQQGLAHAARGTPDMLEAYYGLWTCLESATASRERQLSLGIDALEVFPLDAQLLCTVGGFLQKQGKVQLATQCYANAYRYGQVQPMVWHVTNIRDIAAACYCVLLRQQDRREEALQFLESAIGQRPDSPRLLRLLHDEFSHSRLARSLSKQRPSTSLPSGVFPPAQDLAPPATRL